MNPPAEQSTRWCREPVNVVQKLIKLNAQDTTVIIYLRPELTIDDTLYLDENPEQF